MRNLHAIASELDRLAAYRTGWDRHVPRISAWSVAEQIDHGVSTTDAILTRALTALATPCGVGITAIGRLCLFLGWIPRGRGQAPPQFMPRAVDAEALAGRLAALQRRVVALIATGARPPDDGARFAHPVFGGLTRRQWLRFAAVHLRHHRLIVDDIGRASQVAPAAPLPARRG